MISFQFFFYFIIFFLFASFGSFYKLTADRYGTTDSIIFKPSYCFSCKKNLFWWQNIPIISFLLQRGRCYFCAEKLDLELLLSEVFTAIFSLVLILHFGDYSFSLVLYLLFFNILIWLSIFDLKHKIVPHKITYSAIFIYILYAVFYKKDFLIPFINLGVAFVSMDMLSVFSASLKKIDFDFNIVVVPLVLWASVFFFSSNFYFLIIPIVFFYLLLKLSPNLNKQSFVIFWAFLLLLLLYHSYRYLFNQIDFSTFSKLFVGVGVIYFFCEVIFFFLVIIFSPVDVDSNDDDPTLKLTIGGGDITVFVLISLFLGYQLAFMSLFLSSTIALLYIILGNILKTFNKSHPEQSQFISFVPYLTLACFIIMMVFL